MTCEWNPAKHNGKPCPIHQGGGSLEEQQASKLLGTNVSDIPNSQKINKSIVDLMKQNGSTERCKSELKRVTSSDSLSQENINRYCEIRAADQKKYFEEHGELVLSQEQNNKMVAEQTQLQNNKRQIKHDKIALISLGNPGAGKSFSGGSMFLNQFGAYEIDADEFKKMIPEFKKNPDSISSIHEASSVLCKQMLAEQMKTGANLFIPKVGNTVSSIQKVIDGLKANGYKIQMNYVGVDMSTNKGRIIYRGINTGRYTNPSVLDDAKGNLEVYNQLKTQCDGYGYYWNGNLEDSKNYILKG